MSTQFIATEQQALIFGDYSCYCQCAVSMPVNQAKQQNQHINEFCLSCQLSRLYNTSYNLYSYYYLKGIKLNHTTTTTKMKKKKQPTTELKMMKLY